MNRRIGRLLQIGLFAGASGWTGVAFAQSAGGNSAGSPDVVSPSNNSNTADKQDIDNDQKNTAAQGKANQLDTNTPMDTSSETTVKKHKHHMRGQSTTRTQKTTKKIETDVDKPDDSALKNQKLDNQQNSKSETTGP